MKKAINKISSAIQWFIAAVLCLATLGAFMDSAVAGIFMLLATILICPWTRGILNNFVKKKTSKVKDWMYGVAVFLFIIMAASGGNDATTTEMPDRSLLNSVAESSELHTEKVAENEVSEFQDSLLIKLVKNSEAADSYEEKSIESNESKEPEVITSEEILPTEQSKEVYSERVTDSGSKESETQIKEPLFSETDSFSNSEDEEELQNTIADDSTTRDLGGLSGAISESRDTSIVESSSVADNSSTGAYAVNGKNGKIHIIGDCSATGNGDNAMTNPVYFSTYEEAEGYSVSIKPSLEKRRCGNCWR